MADLSKRREADAKRQRRFRARTGNRSNRLRQRTDRKCGAWLKRHFPEVWDRLRQEALSEMDDA